MSQHLSAFRQAVRLLFQNPAFAFAALLTIAIGIGANIAVYAVVDAVLLEPLPFSQAADLVQVWETHPELRHLPVSVPDYQDWRESVKSLDLAAYTFEAIDKTTLLGQGDPIAIQGTNASSALFRVLGIRPLLGHVYGEREEAAKQPAVLISERLWRSKFSADPKVVGNPLRLGANSFAIAGVLRQIDAFPGWADVWMPLSRIGPELSSTRKFHPLEVVGRLRPGFSLRQAETETENMAQLLSQEHPGTNGRIGAFVVPLIETVTGQVRPSLLAVWMAVGLVLLIACANLAHLMLGRALNRRHDIALRLALGATKIDAARVFLMEASVLTVAGGLLGIVTARLALPVMMYLGQGQIPRLEAVKINSPVLLFGILVIVLVVLLFAAPSFLQVFRVNLNDILSLGNVRSASRQSWLSRLLMGSEIALSLAVLLASIMLIRSFSLTLDSNPGFQPKNVTAVRLSLINSDGEKAWNLFQHRIAPELQSVSGVQEVAAVNAAPMSLGVTEHSRYATRFGIAGIHYDPGQYPIAQIRWCSANYFRVLGITLLKGRLFNDTDYNQPRYVANEAFVRRFFPGSEPVGQKILMGVVSPHPESAVIIGVVRDVLEFGLSNAAEPTLYSLDVSSQMDVLVKTIRTNVSVKNALRMKMRSITPQEAIGPVRTLTEYIAASLAQQRFVLALITAFAGLAVCLCVVGVYGVFSYSVARRLREFGIRSALGARREDLVIHVMKEGLAVAIPGTLAGLALFSVCSQLMRTLLYRVSPTDALSSGLAIFAVLISTLGAVTLPALRAAQADPVNNLREQ